jgi:hypothetical protein
MPMFGGLTPFPLRFGGGVPRLQTIVESLQTARGQLYSTSTTSAVYVENNAVARAIDRDAYGCNERLSNQFYPATTTSVTGLVTNGIIGKGLLSRWETIFNIVPTPGEPDGTRRTNLEYAWQRLVGSNDASGLYDTVIMVLEPLGIFVALAYQDPSGAVSWWGPPATPLTGSFSVSNSSSSVTASLSQTGFLVPTNTVEFAEQVGTIYTVLTVAGTAITLTGNYTGTSNTRTSAVLLPAGPATPNPFPDPLIPTPWYSTICHLNIQVQQPAGVTEGEFLTIVADAMVDLDGLLPAWVTFDWFTVDEVQGDIGFYLDSYENMLRDAFDE